MLVGDRPAKPHLPAARESEGPLDEPRPFGTAKQLLDRRALREIGLFRQPTAGLVRKEAVVHAPEHLGIRVRLGRDSCG